MKLNLGCGHKLLDGFVNVDLAGNWSGKQPDVVADVTKPLPFEDGAADEVHAYHVIEHIYRWQTADVLSEWCRVLSPGGLMVIECPCLEKIMIIMKWYADKKMQIPERLTVWGLYGDPGYKSVEMTHKWCFLSSELRSLMEDAGMSVRVMPPKTHMPDRDMRLEGFKL